MPNYTPNYHLALPLVNDPTDEDIWGDEINGDMTIIDTVMKANADAIATIITVPLGAVIDYAGSTAPTNYLFPYGQAISRVTYAALFAIIGTTYGIGDGSTTFNLPDVRGRVVAGKDDMGGTSANRLTGLPGGVNGDTLGGVGGEEAHVLTSAELASHAHQISGLSNFDPQQAGAGAWQGWTSGGGLTKTTDSSGSNTAHNNVQPTIIFNKIIRVS